MVFLLCFVVKKKIIKLFNGKSFLHQHFYWSEGLRFFFIFIFWGMAWGMASHGCSNLVFTFYLLKSKVWGLDVFFVMFCGEKKDGQVI